MWRGAPREDEASDRSEPRLVRRSERGQQQRHHAVLDGAAIWPGSVTDEKRFRWCHAEGIEGMPEHRGARLLRADLE